MDLIGGAPLDEHFNSLKEKGNRFSEARIWNILIQVNTPFILLINSFYLLMPSADNLCKLFGPRSGTTKHWASSGSKMFDTYDIPERIFQKVVIENNQQMTKKACKISKYIG